jgi:hypothetical protein
LGEYTALAFAGAFRWAFNSRKQLLYLKNEATLRNFLTIELNWYCVDELAQINVWAPYPLAQAHILIYFSVSQAWLLWKNASQNSVSSKILLTTSFGGLTVLNNLQIGIIQLHSILIDDYTTVGCLFACCHAAFCIWDLGRWSIIFNVLVGTCFCVFRIINFNPWRQMRWFLSFFYVTFRCIHVLFLWIQSYYSFEDGLKLVKLRGEAMQVNIHSWPWDGFALCTSNWVLHDIF